MSHRSKTRADVPRRRPELPRTYTEYAAARRRANNPLALSEDMVHVLILLADGWSLSTFTTMAAGRPWLSKGRDGMRFTKTQTVDGLHRRKLLDYVYAYPTASYRLTAYGKMVAADKGIWPRASR